MLVAASVACVALVTGSIAIAALRLPTRSVPPALRRRAAARRRQRARGAEHAEQRERHADARAELQQPLAADAARHVLVDVVVLDLGGVEPQLVELAVLHTLSLVGRCLLDAPAASRVGSHATSRSSLAAVARRSVRSTSRRAGSILPVGTHTVIAARTRPRPLRTGTAMQCRPERGLLDVLGEAVIARPCEQPEQVRAARPDPRLSASRGAGRRTRPRPPRLGRSASSTRPLAEANAGSLLPTAVTSLTGCVVSAFATNSESSPSSSVRADRLVVPREQLRGHRAKGHDDRKLGRGGSDAERPDAERVDTRRVAQQPAPLDERAADAMDRGLRQAQTARQLGERELICSRRATRGRRGRHARRASRRRARAQTRPFHGRYALPSVRRAVIAGSRCPCQAPPPTSQSATMCATTTPSSREIELGEGAEGGSAALGRRSGVQQQEAVAVVADGQVRVAEDDHAAARETTTAAACGVPARVQGRAPSRSAYRRARRPAARAGRERADRSSRAPRGPARRRRARAGSRGRSDRRRAGSRPRPRPPRAAPPGAAGGVRHPRACRR